VKKILDISDAVKVVSMVVLGYGADDSPRRQKKSFEETMSYDHF